MPKRVSFAAYAKERLERREIASAWVERVLAAPQQVEPDPGYPERWRAFGPVPERDGRVLRVVYVVDGEEHRVITAFLDRRRRVMKR